MPCVIFDLYPPELSINLFSCNDLSALLYSLSMGLKIVVGSQYQENNTNEAKLYSIRIYTYTIYGMSGTV